jgi:hypothetical protein
MPYVVSGTQSAKYYNYGSESQNSILEEYIKAGVQVL